MDELSQLLPVSPLDTAVFLLIGACIAVWLTIVLRVARGLPVLPYVPRRRAPWRGLAVLAVFVLLESPLLLGLLFTFLSGREAAGADVETAAEEVNSKHAVQALLEADPSVETWLLCGLLAVVVAPIIEEFTYRLLLQGWLEAEERRGRRRFAVLRSLPPGALPVMVVSALFALRHFRVAGPTPDPGQLREMFAQQVIISLLTLAIGLWLLRTFSGATAVDLGFVPRRVLADVGLGIAALAAVAAPVLILQVLVVRSLGQESVAADPIPLFFLALMLGILYYRTHRIVPAIVLHMAFNATSLALYWLESRAGEAAFSAAGP